MSGEKIPTKLIIAKTGEFPPDQNTQIFEDLIGEWVPKDPPCEANPHCFIQEATKGTVRREEWLKLHPDGAPEGESDEPFPDALYWLKDEYCWRTGPENAADPNHELHGCGSWYFGPPEEKPKYADAGYEIDGITFRWEGGAEGSAPERGGDWEPTLSAEEAAELAAFEAQGDGEDAKMEEGEPMSAEEAAELATLEAQGDGEAATIGQGEPTSAEEAGGHAFDSSQTAQDGATFLREFTELADHADDDGKLVDKDNEQVLAIFQKWDADGNGTISKAELAAVFTSLDAGWTDAEIDAMFMAADTSADGQVQYSEFVKWVFSSEEPDK